MSTQVGAGCDGAMVSLRVVDVDDRFHRFLTDLQRTLVASVGSGLRMCW
jgi:hypothetical protein